jgi:DNA-binding NarL/FixJ family response regulator
VKPRVFVVDDQALVRRGIGALLSASAAVEVVGEADDGDSALLQVLKLPPDVVLSDVRMPRMGGIALVQALRERGCKVPVLLLSTFDDSQALVDGLRAGAQGLLLKTIEPEPLLQAIAAAARGESLFAHLASDQLLHALARANAARDGRGSGPDRGRLTIELTSREQAVLDLMSRGLGNKEIAQALSLAEGTVKNHVSAVLAKLGIPDRMKAVLFVVANGLVRPPVGRKA